MDITLPAPIDIYFASENAHDRSAIDRCFATDAIVRDEGRSIEGVAAIKAWRVETGEKYRHTVEPLGLSLQDGRVVVLSVLSGEFPGSPIRLEHIFKIDGDRITSLEIR
jgi:SnoaL-like protein